MILQIWMFENWGEIPKKLGKKIYLLWWDKNNPMGSYGLGNKLRVDFEKPMYLIMLLAFVWTEANLKSFEHDLLDLEPRIIL